MLKPAATIGLIGLLGIGTPASAGSLFGKPDKDTNNAVAETIAVALLSGLACGTTAALDGSEDLPKDSYARRGWLLGVAGTYATDTSEGDLQRSLRKETGTPQNLSLKNGFGFKGQGGYRCHPRVSAEVDIEWLSGFDGSAFQDGVGKVSSIDFEPVVVTTSLKGYALTGRYQPYLLAGGGVMTAKIDTKDIVGSGSDTETATNIALRFGGGLDFYATERIVLTVGADYLLPFGDLQDLDFVSISWGLRYRF